MKMLNGNISCKSLEEVTEQIMVGNKPLIVPTKNKSYKSLQVVSKDPELDVIGVGVGDIIYVPINSGTEVDVDSVKYTIVNVREIILIVD